MASFSRPDLNGGTDFDQNCGRLVISIDSAFADLNAPMHGVGVGDSVAIDGCCLTVVGRTDLPGKLRLSFDVNHETLEKTIIAGYEPHKMVHVEPSIRMSDLMGGHLVSGHIDTTGTVHSSRLSPDGGVDLVIILEKKWLELMPDKGSVCISGVSLTLNPVSPSDKASVPITFAEYKGLIRLTLIPETLRLTRLGELKPGAKVNVEADYFSKILARMVGPMVESLVKKELFKRS